MRDIARDRVWRWLPAVAVVVLALAPVVYAPRDDMRHAVAAFGFTGVEIDRFALLGCGKDDVFRRTWHAHDRAGHPVTGAVCGGLFKGYTVRVD